MMHSHSGSLEMRGRIELSLDMGELHAGVNRGLEVASGMQEPLCSISKRQPALSSGTNFTGLHPHRHLQFERNKHCAYVYSFMVASLKQE
jgi:hypothetical protein